MGRKATPEELAILEGKVDEPEAEPAGALGSFGLGAQRGAGRLVSGAQQIGTFASTEPFSDKARQEREDIASKEAAKEADFQLRTQEHPIAAFAGEALPTTVLSGGRSPAAALLRGGGTGALSFNPSPSGTALQTMLGGALGGGAQRLVQGQRLGPEARAMGLKLTPEQTSPTILPATSMEGLSAFKKQALKTARFNQKQITKSALRDDLGVDTDRFIFPSPKTKGTLEEVEKRASGLFDDALSGKENILILRPRMKIINELADSRKHPTDSRNMAIDFAKRIKATMAKNRGVIPVSEYQSMRSDLTTSIRGLSSGGKTHALGEMLDILDDAAQGSLSTTSLKKFSEARRLWKNKVKYELLTKRKGIDPQTGQIDPGKFDTLLTGKDAPAYILNKNPSRTTQMMQVNKQISGALNVKGTGQPRGGLTRVRFSQSGPSFLMDRFLGGPLGGVGLKANRLPTDLLTDIPPGIAPPLLNMAFGNPLLGEQ